MNPLCRGLAVKPFCLGYLGCLALVCCSSDRVTGLQSDSGRSCYTMEGTDGDLDQKRAIRADLNAGIRRIERFFGRPFHRQFTVVIVPDRQSFDDRLRRDMGVPEPQRWMVASGISTRMLVLSPRVWKTQSDDHDGADRHAVRDILVHELVHVYHAQHNPSRDFDGMDDLAWIVEGVAVYVSGQLARVHHDAAARAIAEGKAPTRLADAWSGKYRYGVSGSMVRFVDKQYGRKTLEQLLRVTRQDDALQLLHTTEPQFLADWQRSVTATKSQVRSDMR